MLQKKYQTVSLTYVSNYEGGVTSMEPFLKKFFPTVYAKMNEDTKISNYCKFDSQLLTSFTSSLYIAGLVASLFASSVTRAFGRKPSILVGAAAFLVGSALGGVAMNVSMLIFGRIFLGIGIGFANQVVTFLWTYLSIGLWSKFGTNIYFVFAVSPFVSLRNGTTKLQRSNKHWL